MNSQDISALIEKKHETLFNWLNNQSDEQWLSGPNHKWTTGQHILHLVQSIEMLNKALMLPKLMLRYKFGKSHRPSRSYEEVAQRYNEKLSQNLERAKAFNKDLKIPTVEEKKVLLERLLIQSKKLQFKTHKLKEKQLDVLLLPHPLMGKMTLREIIMWTAYHTEHHYLILKEHY